jgi:hypothetical protein
LAIMYINLTSPAWSSKSFSDPNFFMKSLPLLACHLVIIYEIILVYKRKIFNSCRTNSVF